MPGSPLSPFNPVRPGGPASPFGPYIGNLTDDSLLSFSRKITQQQVGSLFAQIPDDRRAQNARASSTIAFNAQVTRIGGLVATDAIAACAARVHAKLVGELIVVGSLKVRTVAHFTWP